MTPDERRLVGEVVSDEYSVLMCAQNSAWSASLTRTSVFIYSLSAAGVTLGFVTRGGLDQAPFRTLALVVLPLVLFVGIATVVRLVQVQRESVIYVTGMNGSGTSSRRWRRRADRISFCRPTMTRRPCTGASARE